jgi:hypothetical protein
MNSKKIIKLLIGLICLASFSLWLSNPSLKEFKEFAPQKVYFEKEHPYWSRKVHVSYRKTKNYFFISYFEVSFIGTSNDSGQKLCSTIIYLGVLNNFYLSKAPNVVIK